MINGDVCIGITQWSAGDGSSVDYGSNRSFSWQNLPYPTKFFNTSVAIKYLAIDGTAK